MSYRTTRDIVIPAGTELHAPPKHSSRWAKDHEAIVGLGKNHTGYFSIEIAEAIDAGIVEEMQ